MFILISFLGLHSLIEMCICGIISGRGIYLVSLICFNIKFALIMFMYVNFWCNH